MRDDSGAAFLPKLTPNVFTRVELGIEDWGAAYIETWADGAKLREHQFLEQTPDFPRRIAAKCQKLPLTGR